MWPATALSKFMALCGVFSGVTVSVLEQIYLVLIILVS
jgi:hypothetical protein